MILPPSPSRRPGQLASLADLGAIPEEEVWLASQKSARTRRAYKLDVAHFMKTLGITTPDQLREVDGAEGPSERKRTVRNGNTADI